MLFQLKDFEKSHMFPVNTTCVLITFLLITHGKFYLLQRQQATTRSPFVISSKSLSCQLHQRKDFLWNGQQKTDSFNKLLARIFRETDFRTEVIFEKTVWSTFWGKIIWKLGIVRSVLWSAYLIITITIVIKLFALFLIPANTLLISITTWSYPYSYVASAQYLWYSVI